MGKREFKFDLSDILFLAFLGIYAGFLWFLYYNQSFYFITGTYESDLPFHLEFAVVDGFYYSLTTYIYVLLYHLPFFNGAVAAFLSLATIGSIFATDILLRKLLSSYDISLNQNARRFFAFVLNFVLGFYIPMAGKSHYVAYQSGNLWHNSTYIVMRVLALCTLIVWLDFKKEYKSGVKLRTWLVFTILLMLTTGVKASFFTVFGLYMAIELLIDLIRKTKFKYVFLTALSVIPSVAVILYQNVVLFGEDTGNSFTLKPFYTLSLRGEHPKVTLILSILFPLTVGLWHVKDAIKDKCYREFILIFLIGFTEVFLLAESGARSKDANFMWGYSIAIFIIFVISVVYYIKDLLNFKTVKSALTKVYIILAGCVLLWHFISGVWYFIILLTGRTYFS